MKSDRVNQSTVSTLFIVGNENTTHKLLENYRITALGDGRCRVEWYMTMDRRGFFRHLGWLTRPLMRFANRRISPTFNAYTENRVAA